MIPYPIQTTTTTETNTTTSEETHTAQEIAQADLQVWTLIFELYLISDLLSAAPSSSPPILKRRPPATKLLCVGRSEFQTPSPDRFIRDDDATLQQQLLGQAQAQREPKVQPDRMGDDLLRETVTLVADGRFLHPTVSTHHSLTGGLRDNAACRDR